jgi:hypothetical protein
MKTGRQASRIFPLRLAFVAVSPSTPPPGQESDEVIKKIIDEVSIFRSGVIPKTPLRMHPHRHPHTVKFLSMEDVGTIEFGFPVSNHPSALSPGVSKGVRKCGQLSSDEVVGRHDQQDMSSAKVSIFRSGVVMETCL